MSATDCCVGGGTKGKASLKVAPTKTHRLDLRGAAGTRNLGSRVLLLPARWNKKNQKTGPDRWNGSGQALTAEVALEAIAIVGTMRDGSAQGSPSAARS